MTAERRERSARGPDAARGAWRAFAVACAVAVVLLVAGRLTGGGKAASASTAHAGEPEGGGASAAVATASVARVASHPSGSGAVDADELARGAARPVAIDRELARASDARIEQALERALALGKGKFSRGDLDVAVRLVDRASGQVLYERDADLALAPASNLKLLTTAAALELLPADWRFATTVHASAAPLAGVVAGDLFVRAGGDPFYVHGDPGAAEARVDALARDVAARGVREVRGALVLDAGAWPAPAPAPGWPKPEGDWTASYALCSGFALHGGLLHLTVETTAAGRRARVALRPAPTGLAETFAVDTSGGDDHDVRIGLVDARRSVSVTGRLGARYGAFEREFRHPAPDEHFAAALRSALERHGVRIAGATRSERDAVLPDAVELARSTSAWLDLLLPINTHSVNGVADALFLAVGGQHGGAPTRAGGAAAVARALERLGVDTRGLVQLDGSGLSRDNRVTTVQLSELVLAALASPARDAFVASLAVAGETGTLADRMAGTPAAGRVRAKTGFIRGASALSGVATAADGRELVFSILVRYPPLDGYNDRCWKPMQDDLVVAFVGHRAAAPALR